MPRPDAPARIAAARSFLFVPGNRPDRFDKALTAGADAVIVDLEDAVPPTDKDEARARLGDWLDLDRPVLVRINGADTPWFGPDLALAGALGVAGIVLPKAASLDDLQAIDAAAADRSVPILPLIETAAGFIEMPRLATWPSVARLLFGSIDFQLDLGIEGEDDALLCFRSQMVLASRVAGLFAPVDGVTAAIGDVALLQADTQRARRLGFGGKLCIHPSQVPHVTAGFRPDAAKVDWARRVLDAQAAAGDAGAFQVDGKMVDAPVVALAERILAQARRDEPA